MGFLHHATYLTYFEIARTEMLRASGGNYRQMEADGQFVVVVKAECRYRRPARYDDLLTIRTTVSRVTAVKIEHTYEVFRDDESLALGKITLAILDRDGNVCPTPDWLQAAVTSGSSPTSS